MSAQYISVFDLDHTLLTVNCSVRFGLYLFKKGVISLTKVISLASLFARHKFLALSLSDMQHKIFERFFLKQDLSQMSRYVQSFIRDELINFFYLPILKRLEEAKKQGHHVAIFSSSPDFLVHPIAEQFGVTDSQASCYIIKDKHFTSISSILSGEKKAFQLFTLATRLGIPLQNTFAYSDSYHDLPFLQAAGHAIAVNPDKILRKISQQNHWQIIE